MTYERALRQAAADVDGLTVAVGHVEGLVEAEGRVVGVVVDGTIRRADLVVDASGRLSRLAPPPELGADAGMAYVTRTYRRRHGAAPGPLTQSVRVERHVPRLRQPTSSRTSTATSRR